MSEMMTVSPAARPLVTTMRSFAPRPRVTRVRIAREASIRRKSVAWSPSLAPAGRAIESASGSHAT